MSRFLHSSFFVLSLTGAASILAQPVFLGRQMPKDPASGAAGVRSYDLSRNGEVIEIELFGAEEISLARCEVTADREAQEVTCELPDRGRFRAKLWFRGGEFENLETGEYFRARFEVERELPEGLIELGPGEELPDLEGSWAIESDLGEKEIMERWGDVFPLLSAAGAEAQFSLGLPGVRPDRASPEPQSFFDCGPDELPMCTGTGGVRGAGSGFSSSACCTNASVDADLLCHLVSGTGCCANTFCTVHPLLGIFFNCTVGGWIHTCIACEGLHLG